MQVGAVLLDAAAPGETISDVAAAALVAEQAGLDSVWFGDHLIRGDAPLLDCAMAVAAAGAVTSRIKVGTATYVPSLRSLAWAARQVVSMVRLVGADRLQLGVSIGAGPEAEFLAAGFRRRDRARRTDEFLAALPALLDGTEVIIEGPSGRQVPLALAPRVGRPTVWIGGGSTAALRRAVQYGDGWLAPLLTVDEFRVTVEKLNGLATKEARTPLLTGIVLHAAISEQPRRNGRREAAARLQSAYGLPEERSVELALAGTPAQIAERLQAYAEAGARHIVILNDLAPWSTACNLLAETKKTLQA